ncbi:hypothetical protein [Kamptonema formosum]|uniref:hypothetical protein n=1 Tax=Kamptonema formosum TaxID=331992 RepID=UPI00034DF972|nr:hypothetical protein [Oscillatoria sp. PCC 10802]
MSENVRTKELEEFMAAVPVSVEASAERLMDDLFQEMDRVLEGSAALPKQRGKSDYISLQQIEVPPIILSAGVREERQSEADEKTVEAKVVTAGSKKEEGQFDKLLLAAACASLVATLGLWLESRGEWQKLLAGMRQPAPAPAAQQIPPPPDPKVEADRQFSEYMLRSVDAIEQTALEKKAESEQEAAAPPPDSMSLADAGNLAVALNRLASALERASLGGAGGLGGQPAARPGGSFPSALPLTVPRFPSIEPAASSGFPTVRPSATVKPSPAAASSTPKPSPTARPSAGAAASGQPQPQRLEPVERPTLMAVPSLAPQSPAAAVTYKLTGVLDIGERSGALFEIAGVAQRINIGESIGSSGWTLVSVKNQEATIRRNGEVRSIKVGGRL